MAAKPLIFHPDAEREYLTSLEWYRQRSPTAALNFEDEFSRAISKVEEAPDPGQFISRPADDISSINFHSALFMRISQNE